MRSSPPTPRHLAAALLFLAAGCSTPGPEATLPAMPERASAVGVRQGVAAQQFMVAAAHPLAAEAGQRILRAGGSALDAAVAVQMVLALVEPQSSGIGGGAFLMHWDGRAVQAWDGRETAPAAADERLLLGADGQPLPMMEAVVGGRAVGVPGAVRMLEAAHRVHGRLHWALLFEPAIELAERGFPLGTRLHTLLAAETHLQQDAIARAYFYAADGAPHPVGHVLRNPALATVLRSIAARGSAALHDGPVAADLVARVRGHARNPGRMTAADLSGYAPRQREALCTTWKTALRVCGFPPPSSGHLAVMQILGLLAAAPQRPEALSGGQLTADWLHVYAEAAKLAYADRAQFVADPDFAAAPGGRWTSLLDADYLRSRAALIGPRAMRQAEPGQPGTTPVAWAPQAEQAEHGTSHVSIVDAQGHAVALTTTIESAFGARLMADGGTGLPGGYLLNNELTDFSALPADGAGRPVANRVQPGKRPRSSMSPTLVFDARSGQLLMVLGSPLGAAIPHFVAKSLLATFDWGLDAQAAVDLPNFANFNSPTVLETGRFPAAVPEALRARGHVVVEDPLTSGLQIIQRTRSGWYGAADPRREGQALGD